MTVCKSCQKEFEVTEEDRGFYLKIGVPEPTLCPECRYQRRLANRNEWNFYRRDCSLCKKSMISIYNPEYPGPVYCQPCYWSDKWDAFDYGRDFDFNRPFFEQFLEHRYKVPRITLANEGSVNSEYTNQSSNNKNCYMTVAANKCEDCMYGNWNQDSRQCVDCWNIKDCQLMYESLDCLKNYHSAYIETSNALNNCYFCSGCRNCNCCFGCVGQRSKSYCWFNEQLTKEEYERRFASISWDAETIRNYLKQMEELRNRLPAHYYHGPRVENSTGDYIGFSKNMREAFNCFHSVNLSYGQDAWEARDCRDLTETLDNELDYEMEGAGWGGNNLCACKLWYGSRIAYSELSFHSDDLFGCVSMIKKQHCIFNKPYSKEEYQRLREKIVAHMKEMGEWGEFFPVTISPFPYNDTVAQNYFPMSRAEVLTRGWKWYDLPSRGYEPTLRHQDLPATIDKVSDDILGKVISCSSQDSLEEAKEYLRCATAFRLHPEELRFYRSLNLPIPHKCSPCRLQDRLNRRNPRKLWSRRCMCSAPDSIYKNTIPHSHGDSPCPNEFETSYAPDRPEIVYCEQCYNTEVA